MHIALIHSIIDTSPSSETAVNPLGAATMSNTVSHIKSALEDNGHLVTTLVSDSHLLEQLHEMNRPDLLFNISTGISDKRNQANIVGMLETTHIPMLGSGLATHIVGLHKEIAKSLFVAHGIRTARFQLLSSEMDTIREDFMYPLMLKPEHEGSGIGVTASSIIDSPKQLRKTIKEKFAIHKQVLLIEEFLPGREFTVGVMGNETLEIMPIKETIFIENGPQILTNDMKMKNELRSKIPADLSQELEYEIREMAEKTYRILRCKDFARIDFRLDADSRPNVIELNTFPGLEKGSSFFPLIAEAAGYTYENLLEHLVSIAIQPRGYQ